VSIGRLQRLGETNFLTTSMTNGLSITLTQDQIQTDIATPPAACVPDSNGNTALSAPVTVSLAAG